MKKESLFPQELSRSERKALNKMQKLNRKVHFFLFGVYVKTIKAKLGITLKTRDGNFMFAARAIYNGLLADAGGFYSPAFSQMAALNTALNKFRDKKQAVKDKQPNAEAPKNTAKKDVFDILLNAVDYINALCRANQDNAISMITGCNMIVVSDKRKEKPPLTAKQGTAAGEILLYALALKVFGKYVKTTYYWQFSIDDGTTWESLENTNESFTVATGMLPGLATLFRMRTKSRKTGLSKWCDAITFYPQG